MQEARLTAVRLWIITFLPISSDILYPETLMHIMILKLKEEKETEL